MSQAVRVGVIGAGVEAAERSAAEGGEVSL